MGDFDRDGAKHHMENIQPRWDNKLNSYALPFFGRVKKTSAKNFQLAKNNDHNTIFLMFGKISKDVFCLDFRSPPDLGCNGGCHCISCEEASFELRVFREMFNLLMRYVRPD